MKRILLSLAAALCMCASAAAQTVAPFKDGDRAVFHGNSITDGGHYHSYIWLYYMTRFPYMDVQVMNAGIGGETAGDMYRRLDGDVFSKRPPVLNVTFGMNDTGYAEYNQPGAGEFGERRYRECYENYGRMEQRRQGLDGVRVVLLGGAPYDETAQIEKNTPLRGKNAVLQRVVDFQRASAGENGWEFLDFNTPLTELSQRVQADDPSFTLTMDDRIHPDNDGHMVMAYLYLKAQGMAGKKVADVRIDAARRRVLTAENCRVDNLHGNSREVSFDYLAEALPYPLDTVAHGWEARRSQAEAVRLLSDALPVICSGVALGQIFKGRLKPDGALALFAGLDRGAVPVAELGEEEALRYLRRQEIAAQGLAEGVNLVCARGRALGFAKRIGVRVNNMYPNSLRIVMK